MALQLLNISVWLTGAKYRTSKVWWHTISNPVQRVQIEAMAEHHVLLIGGHGKIAQLLTPLLLKRSWTVTSLIRDPSQASDIEKLQQGGKGRLQVLVRSLEEVKKVTQAKAIIDEVNPDYVIWSAGMEHEFALFFFFYEE